MTTDIIIVLQTKLDDIVKEMSNVKITKRYRSCFALGVSIQVYRIRFVNALRTGLHHSTTMDNRVPQRYFYCSHNDHKAS
jgi:hypothetical protein